MQSFIVVNQNPQARKETIMSLLQESQVSAFDTTTIRSETTLGIEDVRNVQKQLYFKPIKGLTKAIIVEEAQTLTTEAQNAMLKILEEPPMNTLFFLSSQKTDTFLPTILSRCTIIELQSKREIPEDTQLLAREHLGILLTGTIAQKLHLAEVLSTQKETINDWFFCMTQLLREKMINEPTSDKHTLSHVLQQLQDAYRILIQTNVNARITLEHYLFLC